MDVGLQKELNVYPPVPSIVQIPKLKVMSDLITASSFISI